jgi:transposase
VILVPRSVRVYFATQPMNLHKSFDGLSNEIRHALNYDPLGGHVFVFLNRRKNQVKLIVWTAVASRSCTRGWNAARSRSRRVSSPA